MNEYDLTPQYDSKKSFYRKATVIQDEGVTKLKSYDTIVCKIQDGKATVFGTYSQTTLRHIKEFLKQHGFKADTSSQIIKDYPESKEDQEKQEANHLKMVGTIASLGSIFCNNQTESNNWKARMLKAGLEGRGLEMPSDWDQLDEAEKEKRLNGAIAVSQGKEA